MNAASNVLRILIIVLIVVVIVAVLLMAAMVLIPSFNLFGFKFVANSDKVQKKSIDVVKSDAEWQTVGSLVIETKGWGVELRQFSNSGDLNYRISGQDNLRVLFYTNYTGFIKTSEENPEGKATCTISYATHLASGGDKACIITTSEPEALWMTKSSAKVVILYDEGVLENKKVYISTESGNVYLGSDNLDKNARSSLANVTVESKNANITVGNMDVTESLNITKDSGGLECKTDMTGNMKLSINSGYGAIKLQKVGNPNSETSAVSVNMIPVEKAEAKKYEDLPCLLRVKSDLSYRRAKKLVDDLMQKIGIPEPDEDAPKETQE